MFFFLRLVAAAAALNTIAVKQTMRKFADKLILASLFFLIIVIIVDGRQYRCVLCMACSLHKFFIIICIVDDLDACSYIHRLSFLFIHLFLSLFLQS